MTVAQWLKNGIAAALGAITPVAGQALVGNGTEFVMTPVMSGSGIASNWVYRTVNSAAVNNSTVVVDDGVLEFAVAANKDYYARLILRTTTSNLAGIRIDLSGPAAPVLVQYSSYRVLDLANTQLTNANNAPYATSFGVEQTHTYAGANNLIIVEAIIRNGANPGTVKLQFAQNLAIVANTTIDEGSVLEWVALN